MTIRRLAPPALLALSLIAAPAHALDWPFRARTTPAPVQAQYPAYYSYYYLLAPTWSVGATTAPVAVATAPAVLPVAPRSYLSGFDPNEPAPPALAGAIGASLARSFGAALLQRLRGATAQQPAADPASFFRAALDQAIGLFVQGAGGQLPCAEDLRILVEMVQRVVAERFSTIGGGSAAPSTSGPMNLTLQAPSIQVTIPPGTNIFLNNAGAATQDGPSALQPQTQPQPPAPVPSAPADALGESGPPAFAQP